MEVDRDDPAAAYEYESKVQNEFAVKELMANTNTSRSYAQNSLAKNLVRGPRALFNDAPIAQLIHDVSLLEAYHMNAELANLPRNEIMNTMAPIKTEKNIDSSYLDINGRTYLHRVAFQQNPILVRDCFKSLANALDITKVVDQRDKFGNTPLLLSCITNLSKSTEKRYETVKELLTRSANVDYSNKTTLWSPLTWCAYYGDAVTMKLILSDNSVCLPDHKGCLPIDWAGKKVKKIAFKRRSR